MPTPMTPTFTVILSGPLGCCRWRRPAWAAQLARDAPILVDVAIDLLVHEARGFLRLLFPGEDASGHDTVEAHLVQRAEEHVPVDLALADIEVLVHGGLG